MCPQCSDGSEDYLLTYRHISPAVPEAFHPHIFSRSFFRLPLQCCIVHWSSCLLGELHHFDLNLLHCLVTVARTLCRFLLTSSLAVLSLRCIFLVLRSNCMWMILYDCMWLKTGVCVVMMIITMLWLFQTQFLLVSIHTSQLFFDPDCNYPLMFGYWIGLYAVVFLLLFADFYVKSYRHPAKSSKSLVDAANGPKKLQ